MATYTLLDVLISVVLALITFGIGLSLTFRKFCLVFASPTALITGLSSQLLLLPILAFVIARFSPLPVEAKVGLMILAACPGGSTSNFITYLLNGNTALSISMTTLNSIVTLFTIPLIVNWSSVHFLGETTTFRLPFLHTMLQILFVTLIPAFIGVVINSLMPRISKLLNRTVKMRMGNMQQVEVSLVKSVTIVLLATVFTVMLFAGRESGGVGLTLADIRQLLPAGLLFNVAGLVWGVLIALAVGLRRGGPLTISIEVGLQNTTLAFLVAGTLLHNPEMQKPALVYALFSFWTTLGFAVFIKHLRYRRLRIKRRRR